MEWVRVKNLILGNGINIQYGGMDNTNQSIISRATKLCKDKDFPKHIIVDDPDLILQMIGHLFLEVQSVLKDGYDKYAISSDEKRSLQEMRDRYIGFQNLKLTDVGFEDYYLIYDLFCHKNKIVNPDKYYIRETIKRFFLHSIYNSGKVNEIYKNFPKQCYPFLSQFDRIFTTNYDNNVETFTGKTVYYLHGAFHIKAEVYNPYSMRNQLSDKPIADCSIDEAYYYLYSNALTDFSGFSKDFSITQGGHANSAVEKMAIGYLENKVIRDDVDSWANSDNMIVRNLYESIMLKIANPDLRFDETYPLEEFNKIQDEAIIIGLSPYNDTNLFDRLNQNDKIKQITYYFYNPIENTAVNSLLSSRDVEYADVKDLWDSMK